MAKLVTGTTLGRFYVVYAMIFMGQFYSRNCRHKMPRMVAVLVIFMALLEQVNIRSFVHSLHCDICRTAAEITRQ